MRLPYNCKRRYLTGMDWIIGMLDCMTQRATGAGNSSQIILELESRLDEGQLRDVVNRFSSHFPALSGCPARDGLNLAPFWKMDRPVGSCTVKLLSGPMAETEALACLCHSLNAPFATRHDHVAFHLVHAGPARSFLGMVFDHRLFDARGAEMFLDRLAAFANGEELVFPPEQTHPTREPSLSNWTGKFRAGRNVNRMLRQCAAVHAARFPSPEKSSAFQYQFEMLDESENRHLTDAANEMGCYSVKLPYLLALALEAVDRVFAARNIAPDHYVIPVSIDRRAARADNQSLFFNQFSLLHFIITRADLGSRKSLVKSITLQAYEQTKNRLPEDFEQALMLMRILPVGIFATLSDRLFGGNFGTFAFSYLGESACLARTFLGHPIANLFHTPKVSTPPGIGIFLNEFAGRMNVTTSYLEGLLSPGEAGCISRHFHPMQ